MRVALFFDGKNYYGGWKAEGGGAHVDVNALAHWMVRRVDGSSLWGAHYYTGVDEADAADAEFAEGSARLAGFLSMLRYQPGFFVQTFRKKVQTSTCHNCGAEIRFTVEKEVDTTMVADMLRLAAADAFDILVLVSGDADFTPAADGVRGLGKKVFVATWGTAGLANRLREAAFDHIDLRDFLRETAPAPTTVIETSGGPSPIAEISVGPATGVDTNGTDALDGAIGQTGKRQDDEAFLLELRRAEAHFRGGYVGVSYFVKSWRSDLLDDSMLVRQDLLNRLEAAGLVDIYDAPDGYRALRIPVADESGEAASSIGGEDAAFTEE